MKFAVQTTELKSILDLVKVVAHHAEGTKAVAHSVCLLRAYPETKKLHLDFALNGAFLTYEFQSARLDGEGTEEMRRSIDMELLAGLKFTGKEVAIDLQSKEGENTLAFSSGNLKGKILVGSAEVEEQVEEARPAEGAVDLLHTFSTQDWLKALGSHVYGTHHNAVDAQRRPVRILNGDGIIFISRDKVTTACTTVPSKHTTTDFDFSLVPYSLRAVLSQLGSACTDFRFGSKKGVWRIASGSVGIWFPSPAVKAQKENTVLELMMEIEDKPAYIVQLMPEVLKSCIDELSPLLTSSKEDMPLVTLKAQHGIAVFSVSTSKVKDVSREVEGAEIMANGPAEDLEIDISFKFLQEFAASLRSLSAKTSPVRIRWWSQTPTSPIKGRAICIECESNRFIMARVKRAVRQV